jgi:hypothetical protein
MTDSEHIQADTRPGSGGQDDDMAETLTTVYNGGMSLYRSIEAMRTSELLDVMVLDQRKVQTLFTKNTPTETLKLLMKRRYES